MLVLQYDLVSLDPFHTFIHLLDLHTDGTLEKDQSEKYITGLKARSLK